MNSVPRTAISLIAGGVVTILTLIWWGYDMYPGAAWAGLFTTCLMATGLSGIDEAWGKGLVAGVVGVLAGHLLLIPIVFGIHAILRQYGISIADDTGEAVSFVAMVAIPLAIAALFTLPAVLSANEDNSATAERTVPSTSYC